MPDVKLRFPNWWNLSPAELNQMVAAVREVVASYMECDDYDGSPVGLEPGEIDVFTVPYAISSKVGAVYLLEITGYDYPDRMANMQERLDWISNELARVLPPPDFSQLKAVSVTFYPIPNGCWASAG